MTILYFFDVESQSSQEGLLSLNELKSQYKDVKLNVWAITLSPEDKVSRFLKTAKLQFPVLLDTDNVSGPYSATVILPTIYVLDFSHRVLDMFQGGGKTVPVMVVNTGRLWAVRIPATLLLTQVWDWGPNGLWWAMNLSNLIAGAVGFAWFLRGDWRRSLVADEEAPSRG